MRVSSFLCRNVIFGGILAGIVSILYTFYNEYSMMLLPPIIEDVFEKHRIKRGITINELDELLIRLINPNKYDCNECIIFYTINNSNPIQYGIPYNNDINNEIPIMLPISINHNITKPVNVSAVIAKLIMFDVIIYSDIVTKSFYNPDIFNHTKFGAGIYIYI